MENINPEFNPWNINLWSFFGSLYKTTTFRFIKSTQNNLIFEDNSGKLMHCYKGVDTEEIIDWVTNNLSYDTLQNILTHEKIEISHTSNDKILNETDKNVVHFKYINNIVNTLGDLINHYRQIQFTRIQDDIIMNPIIWEEHQKFRKLVPPYDKYTIICIEFPIKKSARYFAEASRFRESASKNVAFPITFFLITDYSENIAAIDLAVVEKKCVDNNGKSFKTPTMISMKIFTEDSAETSENMMIEWKKMLNVKGIYYKIHKPGDNNAIQTKNEIKLQSVEVPFISTLTKLVSEEDKMQPETEFVKKSVKFQ